MEEVLILNWNTVVKNNDTTYILGDFCWDKEDEWKRLLSLLNGNKVLILGNHDYKHMSAEVKRMFQDIKDYKEITDSGKHIIMCHYPIFCYKGSYNPDVIMLHGHVHRYTTEAKWCEQWKKDLKENWFCVPDNYGNIYNVGCMMQNINYVPRTIDEIINE
jgi:calcineurin-like phosphoesterase family protein